MAEIPSTNAPIVNPSTGQITTEWLKFFIGLSASSKAIKSASPTGSPWSFTATASGFLHVRGGTVSSVSLTRGRITIATGMTSGFFPLTQGDALTVSYTVAPTVNFLPD